MGKRKCGGVVFVWMDFMTWFGFVERCVGFVYFCTDRNRRKNRLRERLDASLLKISLPPKGSIPLETLETPSFMKIKICR